MKYTKAMADADRRARERIHDLEGVPITLHMTHGDAWRLIFLLDSNPNATSQDQAIAYKIRRDIRNS